MNLEEERDQLRQQVLALREQVFQILFEVGEPVVVPFSRLTEKRDYDVELIVSHDTTDDVLIFDWKKAE